MNRPAWWLAFAVMSALFWLAVWSLVVFAGMAPIPAAVVVLSALACAQVADESSVAR